MRRSLVEITLVHMGDVHGHLVPRPSAGRAGDPAGTEGGLARMLTKVKEIRSREGASRVLLVNVGDTIQGSAEALFTRGEALVQALEPFGIQVYAPGNWDWVYGVERTRELFAGSNPRAPWGALAANAYYDGEPYAELKGQRVLPATTMKTVGGVKVGIIGMTTDRGPQVVGTGVTKGIRFTKGDEEAAQLSRELREQGAEVVVMLSELGIANNLRIADKTPGIDAVLSADQHEITRAPVRARPGTLIVEAGQDGQMLGELRLLIERTPAGSKVVGHRFAAHRLDGTVREDAGLARRIAAIREPFVSGAGFKVHENPFNGTRLERPIDTVVGRTRVPLHRLGYASDKVPAVLEGTSHALMADAFREQAGAEVGAVRGFRYGTVVRPGPVKLEDLYHFIPIGPLIAKGMIKGRQLKAQIEASADGSLNPDAAKWTGGWLFNFSGLEIDLDPAAPTGQRAREIRVLDTSGIWRPLELERDYSYASYHYARDPGLINVLPAQGIEVVRDQQGRPLDGVEVVARHLAGLVAGADPKMGRYRLLSPLPASTFDNAEVQPWRGVPENSPPKPAAAR